MRAVSELQVLLLLFSSSYCYEYLFKEGTIRYSTSEKSIWKEVKNVTSINGNLLTNAVTIEVFDVAKINDLYRGAVNNLNKLWQLQMKNCGIQKLSPGAFQSVPNLEVLKLQDNNITNIPAGVFNYMNITRLVIHRNLIETIEKNAFDDMPRLRRIKLNYNFIKTWDSDWFKNCPRLSDLYFRKNEITYLPQNAFKNIKGAHDYDGELLLDTSIYLSSNFISKIHEKALGNLQELDELWLDRNNLEELDLRVFSEIKNLTELRLGGNSISVIKGDSFAKLERLDVFDLSRNNLTCVPYKILNICKRVHLQKNQINCDCMSDIKKKMKPDTKILFRKC